MIDLVIIDFDDTIINNSRLDYMSFKIIALKFNCYVPSKKEIINLRKKNLLAKEIIALIHKKSKKKFNQKNFWIERNKFLKSKDSLEYFILQPHFKKTLKILKRFRIPIVITSLRKQKKIIELYIKSLYIDDYFEQVFCNEDSFRNTRNLKIAFLTKKKIYNEILNKYKPKNALSVGNSITDYNVAFHFNLYHINLLTEINNEIKAKNCTNLRNFNELHNYILRKE